MAEPALQFAGALDVRTLLVIATWMAALLAMFLLLAWISDRTCRALAWWSTAYVIGGLAVASWISGHAASIPIASEVPSALLFLALGMIWTGARVFYGRRVRPAALIAGAVIWLVAAGWPMFAEGSGARLLLACVGIATYTFLTAVEISRDRRARRHPRFQTVAVPLLHASVFLWPVVLPALLPWAGVRVGAGAASLTALTMVALLYAVGAAFLILGLVQDRSIRVHKDAASLDPLTGLFNRRAFQERAQRLIHDGTGRRGSVTLLMFDLDNFKSINDRFGHAVGDAALQLFARVASANMRVEDVLGRLGGEEFAAIVPGDGDVAAGIAERIRVAYEQAGADVAGRPVSATVSIGAAWTVETVPTEVMLAAADAALYRAKAAGRNRVVLADQPVPEPDSGRDFAAAPAGDGDDRWTWRDVGLEVRPAGGWVLEGRRLLRAVGHAGMLDRDKQGLVVGREMRPAELCAGRHPVEVS